MLSVTVDQVLSWGPCREYTRERIEKLFAGRETVDVHDVLAMDIPDEDKLWSVLREELITADILHEFACQVAEQALLRERETGREPDKRSWKAIDVKRKWLQGNATDTDLAAADAAARAAAKVVADAARVAVRSAAWVARAAAAEAAAEAARAEAWAEAEAAAWAEVLAEAGAVAEAARAEAKAAEVAARASRDEAERIGLLKKLLKEF